MIARSTYGSVRFFHSPKNWYECVWFAAASHINRIYTRFTNDWVIHDYSIFDWWTDNWQCNPGWFFALFLITGASNGVAHINFSCRKSVIWFSFLSFFSSTSWWAGYALVLRTWMLYVWQVFSKIQYLYNFLFEFHHFGCFCVWNSLYGVCARQATNVHIIHLSPNFRFDPKKQQQQQ